MTILTKSERTKQFILEKVAPVFNTKGYVGTSMSDISEATGLTKGAIYGNFENKEELALAAFSFNIRKLIWKVADQMNAKQTATEKLKALTDYYRTFYTKSVVQGGCPILNVGIDTKNTHSLLHAKVIHVIQKLKQNIVEIIEQGKVDGEFKLGVDAIKMSDRIYSLIQGSIFSAFMFKNEMHLKDMMDHLDDVVNQQMKI